MRPPTRRTYWPTVEQLAQMGLVPCAEQPCTTWVDPANVPQHRCLAHRREQHAKRREQRFQHRARIREPQGDR